MMQGYAVSYSLCDVKGSVGGTSSLVHTGCENGGYDFASFLSKDSVPYCITSKQTSPSCMEDYNDLEFCSLF